MRPRARRALLALLLLHLLGAMGFALATERQFGEDLAQVRAPTPPRDPAGQRLYILMIDSLNMDEAADMPHLAALGDAGFRMDIQPCFDNFTAACVREMLTGRRAFSLFSLLENFSVTRPGAGPNLFGDARAAGLRTAMLSWGDLSVWSSEVDTDRRLGRGDKAREAEIGIELAQTHDVVFHHWIWHDVTSHHRARRKRGAEKMAKSRARADAVVGTLADGLPPDMSLVVTGDHGHAPDGRHVQGMDVPTTLVARSPNLVRMKAEGRPPSTAVRTVAAAITGLGSPAAQVEPAWRAWMAPTLGRDVREAGGDPPAEAPPRFPLGPALAGAFVALVGLAVLGWRAGLAVALWGLVAGLLFPGWLDWSASRGFERFVVPAFVAAPVIGGLALAGARRRSGRGPAGLLEGAALGSVALLLFVVPGFGYTGALSNAPWMLGIPLGAAGAVCLFAAARERTEASAPAPRWAALALAVVALALLAWVTHLDTNHLRIRGLPRLWLVGSREGWGLAQAAALGLLVHGLVERDWRAAPLGALAVVAGTLVPERAVAVAFLALGLALALRDGAGRTRAVSLLILLITSYSLAPKRQIGALWTLLALGLGIELVRQATRRLAAGDAERVQRRALALLLAVGGLLCLVWTTRLQIAGVNFTFAVSWLPGRLHKELWWVVLSSTLVNTVLPLVLLVEIARTRLGSAGVQGAALAGRVALLRFGASLLFLTGWVIAIGEEMASIRLRSFLQDSLVWLFLATVLVVLAATARPARPTAGAASPPP